MESLIIRIMIRLMLISLREQHNNTNEEWLWWNVNVKTDRETKSSSIKHLRLYIFARHNIIMFIYTTRTLNRQQKNYYLGRAYTQPLKREGLLLNTTTTFWVFFFFVFYGKQFCCILCRHLYKMLLSFFFFFFYSPTMMVVKHEKDKKMEKGYTLPA